MIGDFMTVPAVGSEGPEATFLPGPKTAFPHEPGDAVLAGVLARRVQIVLHARAAIKCGDSAQSSAG